jgi:streptomycin 6-kinase
MASVPLFDLPPRLVQEQEAAAPGWLTDLPELAGRLLREWELAFERVAAPGGRGSLLLLVRCADGSPAALKLRAPGPATALEYAALRRWDGRGAVRALRCAEADGALLLERLHGEISLRSLPEAKAMQEAASAVHRLWVDPGEGHPFPTVAERTGEQARALREAPVPEVRPLVDEALELHHGLLASPPGAGGEAVLLHGDFRQGAVLASDAERAPWLAVGPEPVVGERAYDLARLVRDRLHDLVASPGAAAVTRRRLARLSESLDVDRERLRSWTRFRAVRSGVRQLTAGRRADGEMLLEFAGWL